MDLSQGTVQHNKPIGDDKRIDFLLCAMAIMPLTRMPYAPLSAVMQSH